MFYSYERIIIMEMGQMKNNIEALFKEEEGTEEVRERKRERRGGPERTWRRKRTSKRSDNGYA